MQESIASTKAVYQSQGDLRELRTKVVAVTQVDALSEIDRKLFKQALPEDLVVATEETIFHAQGGGQPSDTGRMVVQPEGSQTASFVVQSVRRNGNSVLLHQGRLEPAEATEESFQAGSQVEQAIDGENRDLFSRIHTGGHLLGLAVRQLASEIPDVVETKAQHYPDAAYVELQGKIDPKHGEAIQKVLDDLVQQDLPVAVSWMDLQGLKDKGVFMPEGFPEPPPEGTRVVEIGTLGGYPCGGTHVHSTVKLGKVKVGKISNKKGNTKIAYTVE